MMMITTSDLRDAGDETLILAHRGHRFGQVAENTFLAYDLALALGSDRIEVVVALTTDGRFVVLHGPLLDELTDQHGDVHDKSYAQLQNIRYKSAYGLLAPCALPTLEEVLEHYRGKALINIDRAYTVPLLEAVYRVAERMDMVGQILFKAPCAVKEAAQWLDLHDGKPAYMPIIRNDDEEMRRVLEIAPTQRFPAIEITFADENQWIFSPEAVSRAKALRMKPLVNTMTAQQPYCGGHDDVTSLLRGPEYGWGWLIDRGAEILQTDCTGELKHYLETRREKRT